MFFYAIFFFFTKYTAPTALTAASIIHILASSFSPVFGETNPS